MAEAPDHRLADSNPAMARLTTKAGTAPGAPPRPPTGRRSFLRAWMRALTDPRTYDLHSNPTLWLGFVLAIPIPILTFATPGPAWMNLLSLTAPPAWAVLLGAAGRVALRAERDAQRIATAAAEEEQTHRTERAHLREEVKSERSQREELEAAQMLIETEMKIAQSIQRTLVPADIVRPDLQVVVRNIPCSYVGGDYLQAYLPRPDLLYLCVGDVSGHGVAAALVVARIHGVVRRLVFEQRAPEKFLEELNRVTLRIFQHSYFFLTFGVFRVDLAARRIEYATAGHPAQFLMRADGRVESLSTANRLLGMDADVFDHERPSDAVSYGPGDSLVLFTDGLFEIPAKGGGEMLGEQGLNDVLRTLSGLPPSLVAGEILQDLADFQGHSKFEDDVSLMVARFDPAPAPSPVAPPAAPVPAAG